MNLHFWRKICINCKCPKSKHDLEDYEEDSYIFDVLGVKIPEHKSLYKYIDKNTAPQSSTSAASATNVQHEKKVEWVPLVSENDDAKRNEKINKYFEELGGERQIPFIKSTAAKLRKEQTAFQLPPHDFNPEKCDNLTEVETHKLNNYIDNIKKNYFGQGQVDVVEQKPYNYATKHDFDRKNIIPNPIYTAHLNAINNNPAVNELMQKMSITSPELNLCRGCDLPIDSAYVKAERLGKHAQWHPKCFKCKKCSQLLVDLIYFHFNNEIYCARDLAAMLDIPRCSACDELILVAEFTLADGKNYHIKHFCCDFCDKPLAGHQYVNDEKTNNPICLSCYDLHHANSCLICKGIIAPNEEGVSIKDFHYHLKCFKCSNKTCSKELIGSRFCIKSDIPFCSASCVNSLAKDTSLHNK